MANHKRKRPKHKRMACWCKAWKDERGKNSPANLRPSDRRKLQDDE